MRLILLGIPCLLLAGCTGEPPSAAAPTEARFRALLAEGNGSNIAVTSDTATEPRLRPRRLALSPQEARQAVLAAVRSLPRWEIADSAGSVLWVTRTTRLFRFVDDLYIGFDSTAEGSVVLVRSASRVGKGDLGQNRRNIQELWAALHRQTSLRTPPSPGPASAP